MIRTRLAPSPTGEPHIGNLYTALINYAFAKGRGGKFILRIEDTDRERFVADAEGKIIAALHWLGIEPDEGPYQGGPYGPYRQSERLGLYEAKAQELVAQGRAYYCFCSPSRLAALRQEQQRRGEQPRYDRHCRDLDPAEVQKRLEQGEAYVIRLKVPLRGETSFVDQLRGKITFQNRLLDDQILLKSDRYPTYHLAVVIDDHLMRISHVIRAEEWISSTPKQVLLYRAWGWEEPQFIHLPLLRNPDGSKLSKRRNPVSLFWYRDQGFLPAALKNYLLRLGWSHPEGKEVFSFDEFIRLFRLERLSTTAPIFDLQKLIWLNGVYLREKISENEYQKYFFRFVPPAYLDSPGGRDKLERLAHLLRERIKYFAEIPALIEYFFQPIEVSASFLTAETKGEKEKARAMLVAAVAELEGVAKWATAELENKLRSLVETRGWKKRVFFMTLRRAATGQTATPPLFDTLEVLGRDLTLTRLRHAASLLEKEDRGIKS